MADIYATVAEYRTYSGDEKSPTARVEQLLGMASARLRSEAGIADGAELTEDQAVLANNLVLDACANRLVPAHLEGLGDLVGATQARFSANGFSASVSAQTPSGSAYFNKTLLAELKRLLGRGMRIGTIPVGW